MKKLIVLIILVLACNVAKAEGINTWIYGDSDSVAARVGYTIAPSIQLGIGADVWLHPDISPLWSVYGIYTYPNTITVPQPIALSFLPSEVNAQPYFGLQAGLRFDHPGSMVNFISGLVIENFFVIEWQPRAIYNMTNVGLNDQQVIIFGVKWEF